MKIYDYTHKAEYFDSKILRRYLSDMRLGVFDIETLGLYPKQNPMILAGIMAVKEDGTCQVRQLFAENSKPEEEHFLLAELEQELSQFDCILTFNGKRFDIPYVRERAARLGFSDYRSEPFNLDLLLHPSAVAGEEGLLVMEGLLMTYLELGGMSLQFNLLDSAALRDAQKHPERYASLQVRVCGWNVLWNDLTKEEQDAYLARSEAAAE